MISTIVQYNTNDIKFLEINLSQCNKFSDEIIITICDHFYNGEKKNADLLSKSLSIINKFNKCKILNIEYKGFQKNPAYYHNLSRKSGRDLAKNNWILFLDSDEIVDDNFSEWFEYNNCKDLCFNFTCNWYFREAVYKSTKTESAGVLIQKKDCQNWDLNSPLELKQFYQKIWDEGRLCHGDISPILGLDGKVLVHHYSWVRNKKEMLEKVKNWSHQYDKNWKELVEEEFNRDFNGTDFIHKYKYEIVENKFKI
jgi:hypothetical protein